MARTYRNSRTSGYRSSTRSAGRKRTTRGKSVRSARRVGSTRGRSANTLRIVIEQPTSSMVARPEIQGQKLPDKTRSRF